MKTVTNEQQERNSVARDAAIYLSGFMAGIDRWNSQIVNGFDDELDHTAELSETMEVAEDVIEGRQLNVEAMDDLIAAAQRYGMEV